MCHIPASWHDQLGWNSDNGKLRQISMLEANFDCCLHLIHHLFWDMQMLVIPVFDRHTCVQLNFLFVIMAIWTRGGKRLPLEITNKFSLSPALLHSHNFIKRNASKS